MKPFHLDSLYVLLHLCLHHPQVTWKRQLLVNPAFLLSLVETHVSQGWPAPDTADMQGAVG